MKSHIDVKLAIVIAVVAGLLALPARGQAVHPNKPQVPRKTDPTTTNQAPKLPQPGTANSTLPWKIGSPVVPWNLLQPRDRWTEMTVTVARGAAINQIKLSQSTLVETGSNSGVVLHTNDLCLRARRDDEGPCKQAIDVSELGLQTKTDTESKPEGEAQQAKAYKRTVWLGVSDSFNSVGTFTGSLFFDTDPFTDTQSITLTVQQTRRIWQLLGVAIIILGVAVAWLVTIFARSRIARDQALLPALALTDTLQALKTAEGTFPDVLKQRATVSLPAIEQMLSSLSAAALDKQNFLPPAVPAFGPSAAKTTEYQAFLTSASTKVGDLAIIVSEGLKLVAARWQQNMAPADLADLEQAFSTIDGLSSNLLLDPQTLRAQVIAALKTFNDAHQNRINAARAQGLSIRAETIQPASPGQKSFISVRLEVQTITLLFWLVWGLLSVVIGATVLIVPVPGFGTITDFVRCFLWGFGLPVAGNSIQNLTMGSLNTQLGVSVTRS